MPTMPADPYLQARRKIEALSWNDLEKSLSAPRSSRALPSSERELKVYFGPEEYEALRSLADHARRSRQRGGANGIKGNLIFLPGIMGSELATLTGKVAGCLWVNLWRLLNGHIENLRLSPDGGRQKNARVHITACGLEKRSYARAILTLRAHWRVEEFPFDWRKDIDLASHGLAAFVRRTFKKEPVHLVAHSMGGLVARNFIRLHPETWSAMREADGPPGGRLIQLGTPNHGSFTIPQVLTGLEKMLQWLEALDLRHNMTELLEIIDTFVGCYQMLPAPHRIPAAMQDIYRRDTWGAFPVQESHLNRAAEFHAALAAAERTIDPERMAYIAGHNRETLCALEIIRPGDFRYRTTRLGDGRVTHELGLLPGVPSYFIEETHGDLARNQAVLRAIEEILETGATATLPTAPRIGRGEGTSSHWHRPTAEHAVANALRTTARRVAAGEAGPDEQRSAEEILTCALLGRPLPQTSLGTAPASPSRFGRTGSPPKLAVRVAQGDVRAVTTPLIVVGHYRGVAPSAAEGALDAALNFYISRACELGLFGGGLGEVFFIQAPHRRLGAASALLAGMGDPGRFRLDDLRYLMMNVAYAAAGLHLESFAMVAIGTGDGGLDLKKALRSTLDGLRRATAHLRASERIHELVIVEHSAAKAGEIAAALREIAADPSFDLFHLKLSPIEKLKASAAPPPPRQARPSDLRGQDGPSLTIERADDGFRFSALTPSSVVPLREVPVQLRLAEDIARRLQESTSLVEQRAFGQLLNTYLIPADFQPYLDSNLPLTLILDRNTAAYPWEMAAYTTASGLKFLGPHLRLTRKFRTFLSSAPGLKPPLNHRLRVLVIADPCPEPELQLPGARAEGRAVVRVLEQFKHRRDLDVEVVARIGAEECLPVDILAELLTEPYDVVHFAGHGVFDEANPQQRGWVFGRDRILGAREIFQARQVPRLVFANACFSAVMRTGDITPAGEGQRQLAGLAEAFFERGIENYLGSGWPVDDEAAVRFATKFYEETLRSQTLSEAIAEARHGILGEGSTWGAYQHYGEAGARLVVPAAARPARGGLRSSSGF